MSHRFDPDSNFPIFVFLPSDFFPLQQPWRVPASDIRVSTRVPAACPVWKDRVSDPGLAGLDVDCHSTLAAEEKAIPTEACAICTDACTPTAPVPVTPRA